MIRTVRAIGRGASDGAAAWPSRRGRGAHQQRAASRQRPARSRHGAHCTIGVGDPSATNVLGRPAAAALRRRARCGGLRRAGRSAAVGGRPTPSGRCRCRPSAPTSIWRRSRRRRRPSASVSDAGCSTTPGCRPTAPSRAPPATSRSTRSRRARPWPPASAARRARARRRPSSTRRSRSTRTSSGTAAPARSRSRRSDPVANPIEMGNTHEAMVATIAGVPGYRKYFAEAFGTDAITKERIAQAIADYERTRMSGNSPYDRWRRTRDATAVPAEVKLGHELFFGKAGCVQCHVGSRFTDNNFHNIGIGWDDSDAGVRRRGALRDDQGHDQRGLRRVRSRRVQDADAARGEQARSVHARRLGGDAARGGRVLQPRRQQEPVPRPQDAGEAARPHAGGDRRAGGDDEVARRGRATRTRRRRVSRSRALGGRPASRPPRASALR